MIYTFNSPIGGWGIQATYGSLADLELAKRMMSVLGPEILRQKEGVVPRFLTYCANRSITVSAVTQV